jgi:hypothetical protein
MFLFGYFCGPILIVHVFLWSTCKESLKILVEKGGIAQNVTVGEGGVLENNTGQKLRTSF